jgi:hypothetical protein
MLERLIDQQARQQRQQKSCAKPPVNIQLERHAFIACHCNRRPQS